MTTDNTFGVAQVVKHVKVNKRGIWLYHVPTNLFDLTVVEYEDKGLGIHDAYVGLDEEKAERVFKRSVREVMKEEKCLL